METESYKRSSNATLKAPIGVQILVNNICNHSCFYCSSGAVQQEESSNKYSAMSNENAYEFVDIISRDINPYYAVCTGGEPTLSMKPLSALMMGFKQKNIPTHLNTNLTAVSGEEFNDLILLLKRCNSSVLTSLPHYDGAVYKKITSKDDINLFYNNLNSLISEDINITVNMVVHKLNHKDVYHTGKLLFEKYGLKNFAATPLVVSSNNLFPNKNIVLKPDELFDVFRDLLRLNSDLNMQVDCLEVIPRCSIPEDIRYNASGLFKRACSAGSSTLLIDYLGFIRPCSFFPEVNDDKYNILKTPFSEIWEYLKPYRDNEHISDECKTCYEIEDCNGGCRVFGVDKDGFTGSDSRITGPIFKTAKNEIEKLSPNNIYSFNKDMKFRKEQRDIYTFFNGQISNRSSIIFVTYGFKQFCENFIKETRNYFTLDDVVNAAGVENKEKITELMKYLLQKKYIYPANKHDLTTSSEPLGE
ncbi:7-carboxy-7-deazaguanine synthase [Candidatus Tiddalikarchaeum anstoanum]|nr:7-carboxy-7-deazaguanine synthase [Candidatus Tiddalikarchaeum anstoanum]